LEERSLGLGHLAIQVVHQKVSDLLARHRIAPLSSRAALRQTVKAKPSLSLMFETAIGYEPIVNLFCQFATVVHARQLVLAAKFPLRLHPTAEAAGANAHHFGRQHGGIFSSMSCVVFVRPTQGSVKGSGECIQVAGGMHELDEVAMASGMRH